MIGIRENAYLGSGLPASNVNDIRLLRHVVNNNFISSRTSTEAAQMANPEKPFQLKFGKSNSGVYFAESKQTPGTVVTERGLLAG